MSQNSDTAQKQDPIREDADRAAADQETAEAAADATASDPADTQSDPSETPKRHIPKKTLFFACCAAIAILIYAIANSSNLIHVFSTIGDVLAPIVIGGIIAYLCNPIMRFYEYIVFRKLKKGTLHQGLSLLMTVLTVFGLVAGILALIVPELVRSIEHLIQNMSLYLSDFESWIDGILAGISDKLPDGTDLPTTAEILARFDLDNFDGALAKITEFLGKFDAVGSVWQFLVGLFTAFKNLFLGLFIAFYILASKEKRSAQVRKARTALLNEKQNRKLTEIVTLVDRTFGSYVKGILLDALIVGIFTFVLLSIFQVSEYNLLIAAICAVTNVIPVFGPFIGAIPSAIIVLISNPSKLLLFIILILVIQQIDGNILVPKIQGNNTGISSLSVLIAITIMGSLFGILGLIIGVPIFAVAIELGKRALDERLKKKGLPTDTVAYYPSDAVGNAEEEVYYEHSHLRYRYDHSKLRLYINHFRKQRVLRRQKRAAKKQAKKQTPPSSEDAGS